MGCPKHKNYKGLRLSKRAKQCPDCVAFYEENKKNKVKESRGKGTIEPSNEVTVEKSGAATIYTHKTESLPKTNEQDWENTSLDIDDNEEEVTPVAPNGEKNKVESKEEGCDCEDCDCDDKTFDDVIEQLGLDNDAVIENLFDFDEEDEDDENDEDINLEDINF